MQPKHKHFDREQDNPASSKTHSNQLCAENPITVNSSLLGMHACRHHELCALAVNQTVNASSLFSRQERPNAKLTLDTVGYRSWRCRLVDVRC